MRNSYIILFRMTWQNQSIFFFFLFNLEYFLINNNYGYHSIYLVISLFTVSGKHTWILEPPTKKKNRARMSWKWNWWLSKYISFAFDEGFAQFGKSFKNILWMQWRYHCFQYLSGQAWSLFIFHKIQQVLTWHILAWSST